MGKRILTQRRGKGGIQYRAAEKGKVADARYPSITSGDTVNGVIEDFVHDRGRSSPLTKIRLNSGQISYIPAVSGLQSGSMIEIGPSAEIKNGNVLPLKHIPEGQAICNIELIYGDGGKLVRASGGSAILFAHRDKDSVIRLPSKKQILVNDSCRASIGKISGGGRLERPILKAGRHHHMMKAKAKRYPSVRGVAMGSVHHPFGGGRHQGPHKSTSTSRNAPPGRKVGLIAARKTGRKKLSRRFVS
jgi:large subunit ribosomal protein L2